MTFVEGAAHPLGHCKNISGAVRKSQSSKPFRSLLNQCTASPKLRGSEMCPRGPMGAAPTPPRGGLDNTMRHSRPTRAPTMRRGVLRFRSGSTAFVQTARPLSPPPHLGGGWPPRWWEARELAAGDPPTHKRAARNQNVAKRPPGESESDPGWLEKNAAPPPPG